MIKITTSGFESDQDEFLIGTFGYPFTSTFKLHGHVYVYYNPFTKKITVGLRKFGDIKDDLNRDDTYEFLKSMDAYVSSETKK